MLHVLYQEGPATLGIFRRSANAKSCRELKEKLNAGMGYLPEGESLFVVAAVFTVRPTANTCPLTSTNYSVFVLFNESMSILS